MFKNAFLQRSRVLAFGILAFALSAVSVYAFAPQCSTAFQNALSVISATTGIESIASAPSCAAPKNLSDEVFFVSCGGFF